MQMYPVFYRTVLVTAVKVGWALILRNYQQMKHEHKHSTRAKSKIKLNCI
jgi:hypothetical protein